MSQVDRHPLIPVFRGNLRKTVPIIAGCIVHQNPHRPELRLNLGNGSLQCRNVCQIAMQEDGSVQASSTQVLNQLHRSFVGYIEKCNPRPLQRKLLHDRRPNAGAPAGDQYDDTLQAEIPGKRRRLSHVFREMISETCYR